MDINIPDSIVCLRPLFFASPDALADMNGSAVCTNRRVLLVVVFEPNRQGLSDAHSRSGQQSAQDSVSAVGLFENPGDLVRFDCRGLLHVGLHERQVDKFVVPVSGIQLSTVIVLRRSHHVFHDGHNLDD
jgi:hypothetical protein